MRSRASGSYSATVIGLACSLMRMPMMPPATRQNAGMQRSSAAWVIVVAVVVLAAVIGFLLFANRDTGEPGASAGPSASAATSAAASVAADLLERRWTVLFVGT